MGFKNLKPSTAKAATPPSGGETVLGPAKNWSFSSLQKYEQCPHYTKLKVVDKAPMPERLNSSAAVRGENIHQSAEDYVSGKTNILIPELKDFKAHADSLRRLYKDGKVQLEEDWAYDLQLNPVEWKDPTAWLRLKLDVHVELSPTTAVVIDWKSGRRFGNEVKHQQQGALYAGVSAMRLPDVSKFIVEFFYVDQNETSQVIYTRRQAQVHWANFRERALRMTTATKFPAKPSEPNCRFCDFSCSEYRNKQGVLAFKGTGVCLFDAYRRRV